MSGTLLSFCEPVSATATSPWHIRSRPASEPLKPGGGATTPTLCERDLRGGWDIPNVPVTPEKIALFSEVDPDGRTAVCMSCVGVLASNPPW